jgi:hypothetical protein
MVPLETRKSKRFRLHSIEVELHGKCAQRLTRDFDFFTDRPDGKAAADYSVTLETLEGDPGLVGLPPKAADQVFPDCVLYREGGRLFYEYGEALLIVDRQANHSHGQLVSQNATLAEEIGYLYLQSEIGRFLDRQGLHRVHALGLGLSNGKAALVLLPSGGGKSTLALELLKTGRCLLLSDDSPLVDRLGRVLPYPMRLSFRPGTKLPEDWGRSAQVFERRKHGPKLLVPTSALPSHLLPRPADRFQPGLVVIGERHGARAEPRITPMPRLNGAMPLLRDLVVGVGVPQVAELLLTRGWKSLPGLAPAASSRMIAASALLARSRLLRLELSRDHGSNAHALLAALEQGKH